MEDGPLRDALKKVSRYSLEICRLRAENAHLKEQLKQFEWQPIAKAPIDGTLFDVWAQGERLPDCQVFDGKVVQLAYERDVGLERTEVYLPSYWMPPPQPPKENE